MWKTIRRFVLCAGVLFVLTLIARTSAARADEQQDYNAYWQDQAESQAQEQAELAQQQQNYNAYWQEQAEQPPQ
jgi:hypothetical protein